MYFCLNCENRFEKPGTYLEFVGDREHGGEVEYHCCPICGDDDYEELKECPVCRQDYITTEKDQCDYCAKRISYWMEEAIESILEETGANRGDVLNAIEKWMEDNV